MTPPPSIVAAASLLLAVVLGCQSKSPEKTSAEKTSPPKPQASVAKSKGKLGAASVTGLIARYKIAHENKDIPAMRAIHMQLRFGIPEVEGDIMVGGVHTEKAIRRLFNFELSDVKLVETKRTETDGGVYFAYGMKRGPDNQNGHGPRSFSSVFYREPYKLLLIGKRPGVKDAPLMEVDPCLGITTYQDRYYLYAADPMLDDVGSWIKTGQIPPVFRPPGHITDQLKGKLPDAIPEDWIPIIRPAP